MPYILEQARSSRSTCKGKCKEKIPQDEWRLGSVMDGDYPMTFWRCLPCVTKKQCSNILEVYASFAEMAATQGIFGEDAKHMVAFFTAELDGDDGTALALANALNGKAAYVEEEEADESGTDEGKASSSEEEAPVARKPKGKGKAAAKGGKGKVAAKAKATATATAKAKKEKKTTTTKKKAPAVPRLSHGQWEDAVLSALAALGAQQAAAAVHELVEACLGEAAYKKAQVTGALGRLERDGLVVKEEGEEPAEEGEGAKKKRKKKPLPVFSLTAAGRARLDGEEGKEEEEEEEGAVVEAKAAPPKKKAKKRGGKEGKASAKKEKEEKGPAVDYGRLERALAERFFCLSADIAGGGGHQHPAGAFTVLSVKPNKSSIYQVAALRVAADPPARRKRRNRAAAEEEAAEAAEEAVPPALKVRSTCTCPDARVRGRTSYCKHQLFVAVRVLGIDPDDLHEGEGFSVPLFEAALSSPRLAHLRLTHDDHEEEAAAAAAAAAASASASAGKTGAPRKPLDEDAECGVCFEPMAEGGGEALSYCTTCGNSVHTQCFANWKQQTVQRYGGGGDNASCVYCRAAGAVVPV